MESQGLSSQENMMMTNSSVSYFSCQAKGESFLLLLTTTYICGKSMEAN